LTDVDERGRITLICLLKKLTRFIRRETNWRERTGDAPTPFKVESVMHRVKEVKPLDNYVLWIRFDDDSVRGFDCHKLFDDPLFDSIKDVNIFRKVHIDDMGLICWDDGTDINPYFLYEETESIENNEI
jgi:hypothetical protein